MRKGPRSNPIDAGELLVLGLAEVAPPEPSLVWLVLDAALARLEERWAGDRFARVRPEVVKVRFMTPGVVRLLDTCRRAVLVTGLRRHGGDPHVRHSFHHLCESLLAASREPGPLLPEREPVDLAGGEPLPAWVLHALPLEGLDHLRVPLPARGITPLVEPHLASWTARAADDLAAELWDVTRAGGVRTHRRAD